MPSVRTPGITTVATGHRFIDKLYRGVRIGMRLGAVTQEPLFRDCAARYLVQSHEKRSVQAIRIHVKPHRERRSSGVLIQRPGIDDVTS